jgi:hypothetical protein
MDIFAHALWAVAAAKAVNGNSAPRVKARWFAAWAAFPDLLAFGPEVIVALAYRIAGTAPAHSRGHHVLDIHLYEPGHSLVVFGLVFAVAWLIFRRPVWMLFGWGLHVLMDIPTHSARYPTPFLWPVSSFRLIGIAWYQPWFMALNYTALAVVFLLLWLTRRRVRQEE